MLIVESPLKVELLRSYVDMDVLSSCGHFLKAKTLRSSLALTNNKTIAENRILDESKRAYIDAIVGRLHAKNIPTVYLATDDDAEGDAIAYDLACYIHHRFKNINYRRVYFSSLSRDVVVEAVSNAKPITLDVLKHNSMPATSRRVLDKSIALHYLNNGAYGLGRVSGGILLSLKNKDLYVGHVVLKIPTNVGIFKFKVFVKESESVMWFERKRELDEYFTNNPLNIVDFSITEDFVLDQALTFDELVLFLENYNLSGGN